MGSTMAGPAITPFGAASLAGKARATDATLLTPTPSTPFGTNCSTQGGGDSTNVSRFRSGHALPIQLFVPNGVESGKRAGEDLEEAEGGGEGAVVRKKSKANATLEVTQGQILSHSPTDAIAFVWELTKETIVLPLGCLQGGRRRRRCSHQRGSRDAGPPEGPGWQGPCPAAVSTRVIVRTRALNLLAASAQTLQRPNPKFRGSLPRVSLRPRALNLLAGFTA